MTVDLKQLLSNKKFIPIYKRRREANINSLGPVAVEFHWTSSCNYRCMHCSYSERRESPYLLSGDVISSVIDDLISLKTCGVYLSGGGEPTTVRDWGTYARKLMDGGIDVALITNGVALQESDLGVLRGMNYIAVSIYSTDEDGYHRITGGRNFENQFILPSVIKCGDSGVIVGARCVLNKINYRQIVSIYKEAVASDFDYIIFIPAVDYERREVHLRPKEMETLKEILRENYNVFDPSRTNIDDLIKRKIHHYEPVDYRKGFPESPAECKTSVLRGNAFINYDGGIYLCQPHIGDEAYSIGNVNKNRFRDAWNSTRHTEVIKLLNKQFSGGLCKNCRSINFNKAAYEYDYNFAAASGIPEDCFI